MLFAQFAPRRKGAGLQDIPPEAIGVLIVFGCGVLFVSLFIAALYYLNLSRTIRACHPRNRAMEPGMVWLNLIPVFNIFWWYRTYHAISDSLESEYRDRRWDRAGETYLRPLGAGIFWLNLIGTPIGIAGWVVPLFSIISMPIGIAQFVVFILYWVRTYQYRTELGDGGRDADRDEYDDPRGRDDYDDRRRRDEDYDDRRRDDDYDDRPRRRDNDYR